MTLVALFGGPQSALAPGGPIGEGLRDLGVQLFIGGGLIFGGTMLLLVVALLQPASPVNARRWILGFGLVMPAVLLTALFVHSVERSSTLNPAAPPPGALLVTVTAYDWWWSVRYAAHEGRGGATTAAAPPSTGAEVELANELRVPVGRPVRVALISGDVIHSFWVPALAGKADMVPGRINHVLLQADTPGVYRGQCAEFCGEQHARMALHVVAEPPAAFEAWLARQREPAREPASALEQQGRAAFVEHRCGVCHRVRGIGGDGGEDGGATRGPDLTHVGSRLFLAAGTLPQSRDALAHWVAHTQSVKPGARMPSYAHLGHGTVAAIAAYLAGLQ